MQGALLLRLRVDRAAAAACSDRRALCLQYEHSEGEPIEPPAREAGECFTFRDEGSCSRGDACRFTHGDADPRFGDDGRRDISGEECRNFKRGNCRLGDDCPRQHIGEAGADKPRRQRRQPKEPTKLDEVCNNYLEGKCRYGDQCRRKHVGDIAQDKLERIDEVCRNFQAGNCRFGDACLRKHEAA